MKNQTCLTTYKFMISPHPSPSPSTSMSASSSQALSVAALRVLSPAASCMPSHVPSCAPSHVPSCVPSCMPSCAPSCMPLCVPSVSPSPDASPSPPLSHDPSSVELCKSKNESGLDLNDNKARLSHEDNLPVVKTTALTRKRRRKICETSWMQVELSQEGLRTFKGGRNYKSKSSQIC